MSQTWRGGGEMSPKSASEDVPVLRLSPALTQRGGGGGGEIQTTKPTHSEDPPAHTSPTATRSLFVF